jgi:hypothetical protein
MMPGMRKRMSGRTSRNKRKNPPVVFVNRPEPRNKGGISRYDIGVALRNGNIRVRVIPISVL